MERDSTVKEFELRKTLKMYMDLAVEPYVQQNRNATNTKLFSYLALLGVYNPEAYILMSECQKILGPPDPIHGGPPFEKRMEPFTVFIRTSGPRSEQECMINQVFAQTAMELLVNLGITRSAIMKSFMASLCGDEPQPYISQFIKDVLTKRKFRGHIREKFSRLIQDIQEKEKFYNAVSVLTTASDKFSQNRIFPQTLSRLFYLKGGKNYTKATKWAETAIKRAPNNSYVADTLGQVYKNRLIRKARQPEVVFDMSERAFEAFKDVETKADQEVGPEMNDMAGTLSISPSFNNRGCFGFIQVAKITLEKLNKVQCNPSEKDRFIQSKKMEVEAKFDFFEWYLTYSKPAKSSLEPSFFWKDVVHCYELYTTNAAADSTSFPSLLDLLNHGLFMSKGRRAGFEETAETTSDLEAIRDDLKTTYESNVDSVNAAERYILSNIILSNKMHNSPQLTPVPELQAIIHRFLDTNIRRRSPEFFLLVLLLFWPERQPHVMQEEDDEEEEEQQESDDGSEDSDEEEDTREEPAQPSLELMFDLDLQQYVTFMKSAFESATYAKYLRGRYLLPLFFLGKGSGLSKWIYKSRLDAIVEEKVDAVLADEQDDRPKEKLRQINEMWIMGDVWRVPEIQDILLPVKVEQCHSPMMQGGFEEEVIVWAGGKKITARMEAEPDASVLSPMLFYLGFTIQGPVVFQVGCPHTPEQ